MAQLSFPMARRFMTLTFASSLRASPFPHAPLMEGAFTLGPGSAWRDAFAESGGAVVGGAVVGGAVVAGAVVGGAVVAGAVVAGAVVAGDGGART